MKDELENRQAERIARARTMAALELHAICAGFTQELNRRLTRCELVLDPPAYTAELFHEDGPNLIQINVRGRILQIEFAAPDQLISTEHFRQPYILSGTVRGFNQEMLESDRVEEQNLFYCDENPNTKSFWRCFDGRTYRTGPFDREYLIELLQQLL